VLLALSGDCNLAFDDVSSVSSYSDRDTHILIWVDAEISGFNFTSKLVRRIFTERNITRLFTFILKNDGFSAFLSDGDVFKVNHRLELNIWTRFESMKTKEVRLRISFGVDFNQILEVA